VHGFPELRLGGAVRRWGYRVLGILDGLNIQYLDEPWKYFIDVSQIIFSLCIAVQIVVILKTQIISFIHNDIFTNWIAFEFGKSR